MCHLILYICKNIYALWFCCPRTFSSIDLLLGWWENAIVLSGLRNTQIQNGCKLYLWDTMWLGWANASSNSPSRQLAKGRLEFKIKSLYCASFIFTTKLKALQYLHKAPDWDCLELWGWMSSISDDTQLCWSFQMCLSWLSTSGLRLWFYG